MAVVRPFKGLRYNPEKIRELSLVITPPYDVITEQQQHAYYERNPYNLIRLEMGKEFPDDNPENSRYTRAAQTFAEWIREGILVREERPAFYLMEHRFAHRGSERSYWGLIAAVRLEEFDTGTIRATEITMDAPIEDRLNLLHACGVNLSSIMGAFVQEEGDLLTLLPDLDLTKPNTSGTDDFGVTFNLWVIDEANTVRELTEFFTNKPIYIADGHHRYTTALTYRKEQIELGADSDDPCNFVMMALISSNDRGLTMLPTHRIVNGLQPEQLLKLKERLPEYFQIQKLAEPANSDEKIQFWMDALAEAGKDGTAFGIYGLETGKYFLLIPHDVSAIHNMLPVEHPLSWRKLDVSLLHGILIHGILGLDTLEKQKECLEYSPDDKFAFWKVEEGEAQLAVFLNAAPISSVMAVADAGDRMPQKSTYFYPKTAAGLVMNPLF